jgi:hypothetical protein
VARLKPGTCGIYSSTGGGAGDRACALAFGANGRFPALAAGATWASRTTSAPWAARYRHTSVVDAAGAIYVIGGGQYFGSTLYQDVWASTNGGARPDSVGGVAGGSGWVLRGYYGVLLGYYWGATGVLQREVWGTTWELGVLDGYLGGTGYSRGTLHGFPWRGPAVLIARPRLRVCG